MTEIKLLQQSDFHILHKVAEDVFDDPIVEPAAQEFLADPRHRLVVALDDQLVVGFVSAVIYVHPLTPNCCNNTVPGIPPGSIEYATDTTRTIAHLVFSGASQKYPDIRWIFSHSGGTLPFLTARFVRQQQV